MIIPSRRRIGAIALIVAGIGAFLVPFLLHSPSTQGTSPTPPTAPGSGGSRTTTTPGSGGSSLTTCSEDKSSDLHPHAGGKDKDQGNAFGVLKREMDKTVATVKSMGVHNPAFHLHHDTDTDNDSSHSHSHATHSDSSRDPDSSCAADEEDHELD